MWGHTLFQMAYEDTPPSGDKGANSLVISKCSYPVLIRTACSQILHRERDGKTVKVRTFFVPKTHIVRTRLNSERVMRRRERERWYEPPRIVRTFIFVEWKTRLCGRLSWQPVNVIKTQNRFRQCQKQCRKSEDNILSSHHIPRPHNVCRRDKKCPHFNGFTILSLLLPDWEGGA